MGKRHKRETGTALVLLSHVLPKCHEPHEGVAAEVPLGGQV